MMKQKTHSEKYLRHRKFLMVVPLLVLPFLTLIFYILGGGSGATDGATPLSKTLGLNTELPDAQLKNDESLNKMSFYDQVASDSLKRAALLKDDPYSASLFVNSKNILPRKLDSIHPGETRNNNGRFDRGLNTQSFSEYKDPNEEKVYSKLAALNKAMDQANSQTYSLKEHTLKPSPDFQEINNSDINRLQRSIQPSDSHPSSDDSEIEQLNGMLDKIMDVQHPERISDRIQQSSKEHQAMVYPVTLTKKESDVSIFLQSKSGGGSDTVIRNDVNRFYSLSIPSDDNTAQNSIKAIIPDAASLISGSTVKMMLSNDVFVAGNLIPKGTYVYGTASINDERLKVLITNIRYENSLFPVKLSVFDLDGMEGVFIPGAISRDVAKSSVEQAVQGITIPTIDPTGPAQAASAGVQATKSLLTRKARLVKVYVTSGYNILLKESAQ